MLDIPPDTKLHVFNTLLTAHIGGEDVVDMLASHCKGLTYREIAGMYGVDAMTAYRLINRAKDRMRGVGLTREGAVIQENSG